MSAATFCSDAELETFERTATPGEQLIYYRGRWMAKDIDEDPRPHSIGIVNRIRILNNLGRVALVQKGFEYIAIYREKPDQRPSVLPMLNDDGKPLHLLRAA